MRLQSRRRSNHATVEHIARVPVPHPDIVVAGRYYGMTIRTCMPADREDWEAMAVSAVTAAWSTCDTSDCPHLASKPPMMQGHAQAQLDGGETGVKHMSFSDESLPERIRRRSDDLSAGQKKIARFCVTEPEKAATLTALRIAEELRVSESTVVRFAVRMGYLGFPDMQAAIRRSSDGQRSRSGADGTAHKHGAIGESLQNDVRLLRDTVASVDSDRLESAIATLDAAETLHVVGFRTGFSLAYLAEYHIRQVRPSVRLVGGIGGTHQDDMVQIGPRDALLAFTFPVYDDRTIEVVEHAAEMGAQCVVITDSALAPLPLGECVHTIIARHEGLSFFNSNVPAVAIANAMVMRMVELRTEREPRFSREINERFQRERARRR